MIRTTTERLPVAVVLASAGVIVGITFGLSEAVSLVTPWIVLVALGLAGVRRHDVRVSVGISAERAVAGDEVEVEAIVRAGQGYATATLEPSAGFTSETIEPRADVLTPPSATAFQWRVAAREWGAHDLGRVQLEVTEPHGLFRWTGVVHDPLRLRVHPTEVQLRELIPPWLVRRISGTHGSTAVDRGIEYADIRPFGPGDALRDINWRASARTGDLWVSQRHADRATDVVLLVDTFVEPGRESRGALGLAVQAAIALADSHLSATDRVGLIELGGILRWVSPRPGKLQLQQLVDALLATVPYDNAAQKDITVIPPRALPPRSFVVALSPLTDSRFVGALHLIAGRGHDVAVIETPPDGAATSTSAEPDVAFRLWLAQRQMTRDALAGHGVAVTEWHEGDDLAVAIGELIRMRSRAGRVRAR